MAGNKDLLDASDYIDEVTKLPEAVDFKGALGAIKKFSHTLFEVRGFKVTNC